MMTALPRVELIYDVDFDPKAKVYLSVSSTVVRDGEDYSRATWSCVRTRLDFLNQVIQDARTHQPERVGIRHLGAEQPLYLSRLTTGLLREGKLTAADLLI
jgi:hypothetical protein